MNFKSLKTLFFPLFKLQFFEKILFLIILLFTFFLIIFDILTISLISVVFFDKALTSNFLILERIISFTLNAFDQNNKIYLLVILLISRNFVFFTQEFVLKSFVHRKYSKYATLLLGKYLNSDMKMFLKYDNSFYLKNITKETFYAFCGILYSCILLISEIFYLLIISLFLFSIIPSDQILPILSFLSLSGIIFFIMIFKMSKIGFKKLENENKLFQDVNDSLLAYIELNIFKKVSYFLDIFFKNISNFSNTLVYQGIFNISPKIILESILAIGLLFIFSSNTNLYEDINVFIAIGYIIYRFIPALSKCVASLQTFSFHYSTNKLLEDHFTKYTRDEKEYLNIEDEDIKELIISNGSFQYDKNKKNLFNKIDLKFKKGTISGLYGESGSGKSTLLNLLTGLLQFDSGEIIVNGKSYQNKKINWQNKLTYMSQNPFIINASLSETLFLSKSYTDDEKKKAIEYLKQFNLSHLIKYFDDKNVSLRNILSGGEKQRLSFIRCLLIDPEIMLLDEPTSALDENNEIIFINHLNFIKKNKIIIMSTHKKYFQSKFDNMIDIGNETN